MAGTRRSRYLPLSLSVHPFLHDHLSGSGYNPVHQSNPCHEITGFQLLRHAFGLHLFHQPLIPHLCLRLEVAQVGHQIIRKEHLHIDVGLILLQKRQIRFGLLLQRAAVLRVREIQEIVIAVQGVMDAVFQKALA